MNSTRHMLLGAFIAFALSVLGYYTLFLNEFDPFGESHEVTIHFPNANGLRAGDSVLVAGVRWGKVKSLEFVPSAIAERRIKIIAKLEAPLTIREGHTFEIRDATMLGGRLVDLTSAPELLVDNSTYERRTSASARLPGALIDGMRFTL